MNTPTGHQPPEGPWYEIRLQGRLEQRWTIWFDGMTLTTDSDGTTNLRGPVVDQAALHGVLQRLRDLGVPLLAVTQVPPPNHMHPVEPGDPCKPLETDASRPQPPEN